MPPVDTKCASLLCSAHRMNNPTRIANQKEYLMKATFVTCAEWPALCWNSAWKTIKNEREYQWRNARSTYMLNTSRIFEQLDHAEVVR